jgi:hypothetical protein
MHPSGMTLERWHWPFKTEHERELVRRYLNPQVFDDLIPF